MSVFDGLGRALLTGLLLMGCGQSPNSASQTGPQRPPFDEKSIGQCLRSPQGPLNALAQLSQAQITNSGYYDKAWEEPVFSAALRTSTLALTDYLFSRGVGVWKVAEETSSSCRYFGFLAPAPAELQEVWQSQGGNPGGPGSSLLGLFRSQFRRQSQGQTEMVNPTILLREDTTRWTILHEQGHFLYSWARAKQVDMPFIEDLRASNRVLFQSIQRLEMEYQLEPDSRIARHLIQDFTDYWAVNRELFSRGPLEEFSIEAQMLERSFADQIEELDEIEEHWLQAYDYMRLNGEPVMRSLGTLVRKLESYQAMMEQENESLLADLSELQDRVQRDLQFSQEKMRMIREELQKRGLKAQRSLPPLRHHHHYDFSLFLEQMEMIEAL